MRQSQALVAVGLTALLVVGCEKKTPREEAPVTAKTAPETVEKQATIGQPGESVVSEFNRRVREYLALGINSRARSRRFRTGQRRPRSTPIRGHSSHSSPREGLTRSRAISFVPEMQTFVRGLIRRVLAAPDGPRIRASLMDENPMAAKIGVNARYPDTVPLSTMPPDVLSALPRLPENLEYRFVGTRLILLDVQAHLVVDFVDNTFEL